MEYLMWSSKSSSCVLITETDGERPPASVSISSRTSSKVLCSCEKICMKETSLVLNKVTYVPIVRFPAFEKSGKRRRFEPLFDLLDDRVLVSRCWVAVDEVCCRF